MATRAHNIKRSIDRAHIYYNECSYTMASNPIYSILWLILLCILAWPVAALCAGLWVVLMVSRYPTVLLFQHLPSYCTSLIIVSHLYYFYCHLQPFEACFGCTKDITKVLEEFTRWPQECGTSIKNCSSSCPAP